jgi:hypothetical protein
MVWLERANLHSFSIQRKTGAFHRSVVVLAPRDDNTWHQWDAWKFSLPNGSRTESTYGDNSYINFPSCSTILLQVGPIELISPISPQPKRTQCERHPSC